MHGRGSMYWRMCEPKYSVEVKPHTQNFTCISCWIITDSKKTYEGYKINGALSVIFTVENIKASLSGSVPYGVFYQGSKTFNAQDIHQNVGLYKFHGIYTTPQV